MNETDFMIVRWVTWQKSNRTLKLTKSHLAGLFWGLATICVIAVTFVMLSFDRPLPFDESRWKEARKRDDKRVLYLMSEDLKRSLLVTKPSRAEAMRMLGAEDSAAGNFCQYRLGTHRRGLFSDYWTLVVYYDKTLRHVEEVHIVPD